MDYKIFKRPDNFQLNREFIFYNSILFAGLSQNPGKDIYSDSTLNAYNGTLYGDLSTIWSWDIYLQRFILCLNGKDNYIGLPPELLVRDSIWWVSCWINGSKYSSSISSIGISDISLDGKIIPEGEDLKSTIDQFIFSASEGPIGLVWTAKGEMAYFNGKDFFPFGPAPSPSKWHHLLFMISPESSRLFVDGIQLGKGLPTKEIFLGGKINIGTSSDLDRFFGGSIADFLIGNISDPSIDIFIGELSDPLNINLQIKDVALIESIDPPEVPPETPPETSYITKDAFLNNIKNIPGFYHIAGQVESVNPTDVSYSARPVNFYTVNVRFVTDNIYYHHINFAVENEGTSEENAYYVSSRPDVESQAKVSIDSFGSLYAWDIPDEPICTTIPRPAEKLQVAKNEETAKINAEIAEQIAKISIK